MQGNLMADGSEPSESDSSEESYGDEEYYEEDQNQVR